MTTSADLLEDRVLLTIDTLSVAIDGTTGDEISNDPQISRDGRFVAFQSRADDLVADGADANGFQDIFVRNLEDGTTTLLSVTPEGRAGDDDSWSPTISDDGRFVAFASFATTLGKSTTITAGPNVYVHDRDTDEDGVYDEAGATSVTLLSHSGTDELMSGNGPSGGITLGAQWENRPQISGNGEVVVYVSAATNLLDPAEGVTVGFGGNVYVTTTRGARTTLVSVDPAGTTSGSLFGGGFANSTSISFDGRYVAFFSNYDNLVAGDVESRRDVFVRDIAEAVTTRVSVDGEGRGGNLASREPVISRNGRHVVFTSRASNLVDGDTNGTEDTFVYDMLAKRTSLISLTRDPASTSSSGNDSSPSTAGPGGDGYAISDNGRYVLFTSQATDLLDPADGIADTNGTLDVFFFDRDADGDGMFDEAVQGGTTTSLVSINAEGAATSNSFFSTGGSSAVSLSGDGRHAVFVSSGTNLIPGGTPGTGVYLRDLMAETTDLVGLTGLPGALQAGVAEAGLSTRPLQVAFSSFATDVDPAVTDENVGLDVFRYTAPTDLRFLAATADGEDRLVVAYSVENVPADGPFEIGVYLSTDGTFDLAEDDLLDTITISGSDLEIGERKIAFDIGSGEGEVAMPGAGAPEVDSDYQILFVVDHLNAQEEIDGDPFNDDNTGRFEGIYHPPGGPVFIHGRTSPRLLNDSLMITEVDASTLGIRLNKGLKTYDPADVSSVRFRGHEGRDFVQAAGTDDLLLGGAGNDVLRGGSGDDTIDGGVDDDRLFGEAGFDTIFDGMGDDTVDLGPDGGVIVATPGSDDIFLGAGDTLDFSFADRAITIDLDLNEIQTVDEDLNTIKIDGVWDNFIGSAFDDFVRGRLTDRDQVFNGGNGNDRISIDAGGSSITFDGTTLVPATGGSITLINFEDVNVFNLPPTIIDNSDTIGFTDTGFFDSNPNFPQGFNDGVKFSGANTGNTATWTFSDIVPGRYAVSSTWTNAPDRAKNAPFTIFDGVAGSTVVSQQDVNQEHSSGEFEDAGVSWSNLDFVDITGTTLTVQLSDMNADEFVVADAIRIERISSDIIVVDDRDSEFSNGTGTLVEGDGLFGMQESFSSGTGNTVATWDLGGFDLLSGPYVVAATWNPITGAATDAKFTVASNSESFSISVDQSRPPIPGPNPIEIAGVGFQRFGVCADGSCNDLTVALSDDADGLVLADAVALIPAPQLTVLHNRPLLPAPVLVENGGSIDLGTFSVPANGGFVSLDSILLQNSGIATLLLQDAVMDGPFDARTLADFVYPNGQVGLQLDLTTNTPGTHAGTMTVPSNDPFTMDYLIHLSATIIDDTLPPLVQIASPSDDLGIVEGATIAIEVDAIDDAPLLSVELFVDGVLTDSQDDPETPIMFEFTMPFLEDPQTPQSEQVTLTARAIDGAGNSSMSDPVIVNLTPSTAPAVTVFPPAANTDPFVDSFFELHADVEDKGPDIVQVEFLVNGVVVDTVHQAPYFGQIPQLIGTSKVTAVALDVFGTAHTSASLNFEPAGPGNVDGDADFDANDSFLIQLVKLSGSDFQIDQNKGSSSKMGAEIRDSIIALGTAADVDGDSDVDANDAFLMHLVQLSGSDSLIDLNKGASPLTATQIRANIQALGRTAEKSATGASSGHFAALTTDETKTDLFSADFSEHPPRLLAEQQSQPDDSVDELWRDDRSWLSIL